jgi:hypothetical protein
LILDQAGYALWIFGSVLLGKHCERRVCLFTRPCVLV